ncbi:MAG: T9SS type A sorting domain-containing protein [Rhodothermales bacterium]|nr:T9SS type A sorting domain-containing protein [Rhodothermales bacterium]
MKKVLIPLAALLLIPVLANAQTEWDLQGEFWPQILLDNAIGSGHGIAVDGMDRLWFQPFSKSDSVDTGGGVYEAVSATYVFNADMSLVEVLKFVSLPGGVTDTLGFDALADNGRGLRADGNGDILMSLDKSLYYLDHTTVGDGDGIATGFKRAFNDGSTGYCAVNAAAVATDTGNIFIGSVCSGDDASPRELNPTDLGDLGNVADISVGFSRSFEVSPDGNSVLWAGYTNNAVILYQRADEFSAWDSIGTVLRGMDSESMTINRATGNLWVGSGSPNDAPNRYVLPDGTPVVTNWNSNTWYEFALADVIDGDAVETPLGSITWGECQTFTAGVCNETGGRPRGLAFSNDGNTAWVTQFSQTAPAMYYYTVGTTSIDQVDSTVPESYTLSQNYPNPFNPSTTIEFALKESQHAQLSVFDMMGREVAVLVDQTMMPGTYEATFNADNLSSGIYLYRLQVGATQLTGTMTLLK